MKRVSTGGLDEVKLEECSPGIVLATYPMLKPCMDWSGPMTNTVGGRPTERRGLSGGVIRGPPVMSGGIAHDVPLPPLFDSGAVLASYPELKKPVEEIVGTNDVGGRPDERLGKYGSFTTGVRTWSGGEPHDVPRKENYPEGVVLAHYPSLKKRMVEDEVLDQMPPSEGVILGVFPELAQKGGDFQVRPNVPLHAKDKSFHAETTKKLDFKPWLVPDWKPKVGVRPILGDLQPMGKIKIRSTAAPSA